MDNLKTRKMSVSKIYRPEDFERMVMNVYQLPQNKSVFKAFEVLNKHKIFSSPLPDKMEIEKVIRYIAYAFDPNSPLMANMNIIERRVDAASLAGLSNSSGKFAPAVERMLRSEIMTVNMMIIEYCVMTGGQDYLIFRSFEEALRSETAKLFGADSENSKVKDVISNIKTLNAEMKNYEDIIFSSNSDLRLKGDLYDYATAEGLMISPEDYANSKAKLRYEI